MLKYYLKALILFICLALVYSMESQSNSNKDEFKNDDHQHKRDLVSVALHVQRGPVPTKPHNVTPKNVASGLLLQDKRPTTNK